MILTAAVVRSCVRPVSAVLMTAGPDEVREPGHGRSKEPDIMRQNRVDHRQANTQA